MNSWNLIRRSLWFYRRTHLGVVLGTALASAVLIGALAVGDSLRGSLHAMALTRLGNVQAALTAPEEFFSDAAGAALAGSLHCDAAAALALSGTAENEDRSARANQVAVLGVDERFWGLCPTDPLLKGDENEQVVLNEPLARRLGVRAGDRVFIRLPKPSLLPMGMALSSGAQPSLRLAMTVKTVAGDDRFGRFSLLAGPTPLTAFVPLRWLQQRADLAGQANTLLAGGAGEAVAGNLPARANEALREAPIQRQMLGVEVGPAKNGDGEVRSSRVFIPPPVAQALSQMYNATGVFTYFVNDLRDGNRDTPYSMVTGAGPLSAPYNVPSGTLTDKGWVMDSGVPYAQGLKDDQIGLTDWLNEDLAAKAGDELALTYFVLGPAGRLAEQTSRFRVAAATPLPVGELDPKLMPDFPGIAEANNTRDWRPGIPIALQRLRPKDEKYWSDHRGTPKALVTLAAAQKMWGNRFGRLTAIRFPAGSALPAAIADPYLAKVDPASLGFVFRPVREEALAAAAKSMDFGWLFAGMSMFLIFSALLLTGLLFGLSVRQRSAQVGTLLAMGFTPGHVRRLLLGEGAGLAAAGVAIGAAAAVGYGAAVLSALRAILPSATDAASLRFHVSAATLGEGAAMSVAMALGTMWLVLRRQTRSRAAELLSGGPSAGLGASGGAAVSSVRGLRWARAASVVMPVGALAAVAFAAKGGGAQAAGVFFGAGAMLLAGGVAAAYAALARRLAGGRNPVASLASLGSSNSARRLGRSIAVVAMLACGTFVVVAVGANWKGPSTNPYDRASGTGGFALLAQTASPIGGDPFALLDPPAKGPAPSMPPGVSVVPIRVRQGDEASCLNLNRPQQPAVWGVDPNALRALGAFSFDAFAPGCDGREGWGVLDRPAGGPREGSQPDGAVPAIADATTLEWALGVGVDDVVTVQDEQGRAVQLRIVASLSGSILQGGLLISEEQFLRLYPSSGGYRMFLLDSPPALAAQMEKDLSANRFLQDAGLDVVRTSDRLAQFDTVENAYLSMFQVLGGLGVLLGTAGLGLVVFRNVMERRGELGLMRAVGFSTRQLRALVLWEHWFLLAMGLGVGVAAGLAAALPGLRGAGGAGAAGSRFPWAPLACTVLAIAASGLAWTALAAAFATRGRLIAALRNE
jgi:ABC-type lipoprotein release transport system permease subunit